MTWPLNRLVFDKKARMKKIDTRALTPAARDEIRKMVIRLRQQSGINAAGLAAIAGVHPGTVLKWLSWARSAGEGSLTEKPRGRPVGSCRKLTLAQELWVRETVIGQNPKQAMSALRVVDPKSDSGVATP